MSVGPKLFLLKSPEFDCDHFQDQLAKSCQYSTYSFSKLSELECFKQSKESKSLFIFIVSFSDIDTLQQIRRDFESSKCIVLDDEPSLSHALIASKKGADKYYPNCSKSVEAYLRQLVNKQEQGSKKLENEELREQDFFCSMIGRSKVMKDVFSKIEQVSRSSSTVLITGASGCGKELVAHAIHSLSARSDARQISINCGAIPSELLESELFGHVKGAFTGAINDKKGKFELADKGSLFLDEIGDMEHSLQVKLLRALQSKKIEAVGADDTKDIDVRIIAATHQDLKELVSNKLFREDLYYRLNVIPIHLPKLKERREDIPLLITHFIEKVSNRDQINPIQFSKQSMELLLKYEWPGNIRELENLIERLMVLRSGHYIEAIDLPDYIFSAQVELSNQSYNTELPAEGINLKDHLAKIELSYIEQALSKTNGNKKQASDLLGIKRTTLVEKIKKLPVQSQKRDNVYS